MDRFGYNSLKRMAAPVDEKLSSGRGMELDADSALASFCKKPLFVWAKSFDDPSDSQGEEPRESFKGFVTGNALSYAFEYIGLVPESEQSSLHLSAIFEEESYSQSKKFPMHYESETKNRIQNLNRMYLELLNYYEDHFRQLVALPPPNNVHILSECRICGVQELEKFLILLLGAAIQGSRKQDTIKRMKKFPAEVQEALVEYIKMMKDHPEVLHLKSWSEFTSMDPAEQQKLYEALLVLVRRLLLERNQRFQTQLMTDYFSGHMYCGQRKSFDGKCEEDPRLTATIRQLKEELYEKTELLQECRDELEVTKNRVEELQTHLTDTRDKLKAYKQARDELDALREGHDKTIRLEAELDKLRKKLQEHEQLYDRAEHLQNENRSLQQENESLLEQNSFLTIEKESLKLMLNNESLNDSNSILFPFQDDAEKKFQMLSELSLINGDEEQSSRCESELRLQSPILSGFDFDQQSVVGMETPKKTLAHEYCQTDEASFASESVAVDTSDFSQQVPEIGEIQLIENLDKVNGVTDCKQVVRRGKRSNTLSVKKSGRSFILPIRGAQKLLPVLTDIGNFDKQRNVNMENFAIKVVKVMHGTSPKRKCFSRSGSAAGVRPKSLKRRLGGNKNKTPLDMEHDADEELSISPNGPRNLSDIENCPSPAMNGTRDTNGKQALKDDSDDYFTCANLNGGSKDNLFESKNMRNEKTFLIDGETHENCINFTLPISPPNVQNCMNSIRFPVGAATLDLDVNFNESKTNGSTNNCICPNGVLSPAQDPRISVNISTVQKFTANINLNLKELVNGIVEENLHHLPITNALNGHNDLDIPTPVKASFDIKSSRYDPSSSSEDEDSVWFEYGCV